jgi:HEAT repeat protein
MESSETWEEIMRILYVVSATALSAAMALSCGPGREQSQSIEDLIQQLRNPSPELRVYAARKLAERGAAAEPASPALFETLGDTHEVRIQLRPDGDSATVIEIFTTPENEALLTLVAIGNPVVAPVAAAAANSDTFFSAIAAKAGATDPVGWRRMLVSDVLAKVGAPATQALAEILRGRDAYHEYVRQAAAEALATSGDPTVVDALIGVLGEKGSDLPGSAAIALGELGDPAAIEPLFELMLSRDVGDDGRPIVGGWTRERVYEALEKLTGKSWSDFNHDAAEWHDWWQNHQQERS